MHGGVRHSQCAAHGARDGGCARHQGAAGAGLFTGRIGVSLPDEKIENAIAKLPSRLNENGSLDAGESIMTSDTFQKNAPSN